MNKALYQQGIVYTIVLGTDSKASLLMSEIKAKLGECSMRSTRASMQCKPAEAAYVFKDEIRLLLMSSQRPAIGLETLMQPVYEFPMPG
eukprot:1915657-Pleurochrysis_carterae.AAC.1